MKRFFLASVYIVGVIVFATLDIMAQAPPPSSNPPGAPLDGMTSILLATGVFYALKKFKGDGKGL